jgi:hypothetical protein
MRTRRAAGGGLNDFVFVLEERVMATRDARGVRSPSPKGGLNMSKLESRPVGSAPWQYSFYLDVGAGTDDPTLTEALGDMRTW